MASVESAPAAVTIPFYKPAVPRLAWEGIVSQVKRSVFAGRYTKGPCREAFRQNLAAFLGVDEKRIILCGSGSAAIAIAARALLDSSAPGYPMVVPGFRYKGTLEALRMGGWPKLDDGEVGPHTWNLIGEGVPKRWSLSIDIFGNPAGEADIIDSAHSLATADMRKRRGSFECFSLAASKVITGGEGGVILVNDENLIEYTERLASLFSRLGEFNAALALWHLQRVTGLLHGRMEVWDYYKQNVPCRQQTMALGFTPSVFAFRTKNRDLFFKRNALSGVETRAYYADAPPPKNCPIAERIRNEIVALPLFDGVNAKDVVDRLWFP